MALSNDPVSEPFTYTSSVDASSFASQFSQMSGNMNSNGPFATSTLDSSQLSSLSSVQASILSKVSSNAAAGSSTLGTVTTPTSGASAGSVASSAAATSTLSGGENSTSNGSSQTASSVTSSVASSATAGATSDLHKESSGGLSSPGMQAAVAVPVVVVVLAAIALLFFCMRRRKRRATAVGRDETEKHAPVSKKKKWTRHLRVFSFDAELLMGGRYSSTNSIRSRQTGSLRSASRSQHSDAPSLHSIEEVAPPYRDAISSAQPPNISSATAAPVAASAAAGVTRSASSATAPPPYGATGAAAVGKLSNPTSPTSPTSQHDNPFSDNSPISPIDTSPFRDPPGTTPAVSRNSSIYHSERDETSTIGGASDAASIREATFARNASVMSGGRVIDNVNHQSS